MCTNIFQTFAFLPCSPYIVVGLSPRTEVHSLSARNYQSDPHPLHFYHFPLVRVYSLGAQVITRALSAYSHLLIPVRCIPMAIRKFVCHIPTAIGLALVCSGVGAHLF